MAKQGRDLAVLGLCLCIFPRIGAQSNTWSLCCFFEVPPVKKHGKFQCPRAGQIVGPRRPEKKFGGRATAGFD